MNQLENLTPFKKGQSGNPNGRPKGSISITTKLKDILSKKLDYKDPFSMSTEKKEIREIMALELVRQALQGKNLKAIQEIMDRVEGKPIATQINVDSDKTHEDWMESIRGELT